MKSSIPSGSSSDDDDRSIIQQKPEIRIKIILSFWSVIIMSLPIWWHTTKIERHHLPESKLQHWNSLHPCPIRFPIYLNSNSHEINTQSLQREINRLSSKLDSQKLHYQDEIDILTARCFDLHLVHEQLTTQSESHHVVYYSDHAFSNRTSELPTIPIHLTSSNKPKELLTYLAPLSRSSISNRGKDSRVITYSSKLKLIFSLMNEDLTRSDDLRHWEIRESIRVHLAPILMSLSSLHNFTIETQILHYAPLTSKPIELHSHEAIEPEDQKLFIVEEEDLKAFINEADWNLASPVSMDPVLHFVLYVPSREHRPFKIRRQDGTIDPDGSFIRPQWGSVMIYNPSRTSNLKTLSINELERPMEVFRSHLLSLLGISTGSDHRTSLLERSSIIRRRILETSLASLNDLNVIVQLINDQKNMRVGRDVQRQVGSSLQALEIAQEHLKKPSSMIENLSQSIIEVSRSRKLASESVFNPTMVPMLYFPDEHKYAIYTPLFGPILVPLVITVLREFKSWMSKRREEKNKVKEE